LYNIDKRWFFENTKDKNEGKLAILYIVLWDKKVTPYVGARYRGCINIQYIHLWLT